MISRTGHAALCKALYILGVVALRHNSILAGLWGTNENERAGTEGGAGREAGA